jgi:CRISPR-associated endonuclease/helicase Cas3
MMTFDEFFEKATHSGPFPYQRRLAEVAELYQLMHAPTGAGKTAAAIIGWLWRRRFHHDEGVRRATPRRLVYCLPMRVLVEQTHEQATIWLGRHDLLAEQSDDPSKIRVHLLMGGDVDDDWALYPERNAILVGTQDMLLSRALNRGYAQSRFRWPIDFGLLNNDCLWVLDEVQLMSSGLTTSAQLAAFRGLGGKPLGSGNCPTVWMSATMDRAWLNTVGLADKYEGLPILELSDADRAPGNPLQKRMTAAKTLRKCSVSLAKEGKAAEQYATKLAEVVRDRHKAGSQTLVVLNTVARAKMVHAALHKRPKGKSADPESLLIHSQFRPFEREELANALKTPLPDHGRGRIIVATQVIEAGVDLSSRSLFTELAPWASLVQRFGRCHRFGEHDSPAEIFWIDLEDPKLAPPYAAEELDTARGLLKKREGDDVSPESLESFMRHENVSLPFQHNNVLRRRDLIDLFDTSPDLSGNDIDISRFIREGDEHDVELFWRDWEGNYPPSTLPRPRREELCPAAVFGANGVQSFLKGKEKHQAFRWDHLEKEWQPVKWAWRYFCILIRAVTGGPRTPARVSVGIRLVFRRLSRFCSLITKRRLRRRAWTMILKPRPHFG